MDTVQTNDVQDSTIEQEGPQPEQTEQKTAEPLKAEEIEDFKKMDDADKRALEDKKKKIDKDLPYTFSGGLKSAADSKTVEGSANSLLLTVLFAPFSWAVGLMQKWVEKRKAEFKTQLKNAEEFNKQVRKDRNLTEDQARDYLFQDFIKTHDDKAKINAEWSKTHPEIYADFTPDENGVYSPKDQREIDARILQIRHGELYGRTMFVPEVEGALNEVDRIHILPLRENFVVPDIHNGKAVAQSAEPEKQQTVQQTIAPEKQAEKSSESRSTYTLADPQKTVNVNITVTDPKYAPKKSEKRPTYTLSKDYVRRTMTLRDAQKDLAKAGNTETFKAKAHELHLRVEGLQAQKANQRSLTVNSAQFLRTNRDRSNG